LHPGSTALSAIQPVGVLLEKESPVIDCPMCVCNVKVNYRFPFRKLLSRRQKKTRIKRVIYKSKHFDFAKMPIGILTLGDTKVSTPLTTRSLDLTAFPGCSLNRPFRLLSLAQLRLR